MLIHTVVIVGSLKEYHGSAVRRIEWVCLHQETCSAYTVPMWEL